MARLIAILLVSAHRLSKTMGLPMEFDEAPPEP